MVETFGFHVFWEVFPFFLRNVGELSLPSRLDLVWGGEKKSDFAPYRGARLADLDCAWVLHSRGGNGPLSGCACPICLGAG